MLTRRTVVPSKLKPGELMPGKPVPSDLIRTLRRRAPANPPPGGSEFGLRAAQAMR